MTCAVDMQRLPRTLLMGTTGLWYSLERREGYARAGREEAAGESHHHAQRPNVTATRASDAAPGAWPTRFARSHGPFAAFIAAGTGIIAATVAGHPASALL